MSDQYGPYTTSNGNHTISCAIRALALTPTPAVTHHLGSTATNFWGTPNSGTTNSLVPAAGSVGDLLVAAVCCTSSGGQGCTPPAGWTSVPGITGSGTDNLMLFVFWKIAVAGDLTGPNNFVLANSVGRGAGAISAWDTGTFNATDGVVAVTAHTSAADETLSDAPASPLAGDYVIEVFAGNAADGSVLSTITSAPGRTSYSGIASGRYRIDFNAYLSPNPILWNVGRVVAGLPYWH